MLPLNYDVTFFTLLNQVNGITNKPVRSLGIRQDKNPLLWFTMMTLCGVIIQDSEA